MKQISKVVTIIVLVVSAMSVKAETHYLDVGETLTLYLPPNVSGLALKGCIWTSARPDDVEILSQSTFSCKIKAVKTFTSIYPAIIHCEYYYYENFGGYTYLRTGYVDYDIYVNEVLPTSVSLRSSLTLNVGGYATLTPTIYPSNAVTTYTWSSSDYSVASVSTSGYVSAQGSGTARITVMTSNGLTASCLVTVKDVYATGISLTEAALTLPVGESKKLKYTITPSNSNSAVSWSSDNTSVVTVNSSGQVTAISAGTARVTIKTDNGYSATCVVTVPPLPEWIVLPDSVTVGLSMTKKIKYSFYPVEAAVSSVSWECDDTDVAIVNQQGEVTAVGVGSTTVTAETSNGCVSKCAIIVPEPSYSFYVWTVGGEKIGYPLATRPKVVYDGENIVLTTHSETVEYPAKDVWKYTLEDEMSMQQPESSIEPPVIISPTMRQTEREVNISGCRPGSSVMLYSLGGVLLQTELADSEGNLQLSISDYVQGVYIIKTETITYKIIKR